MSISEGTNAQEYYAFLKKNNLILFECITGSQVYGTALPTSDVDKKFIYIDPLEKLLNNTGHTQLNVNKDYVGYEVGRFFELIQKSSPNMIEILYTPEEFILQNNVHFYENVTVHRNNFLTNQIYFSFAQYAKSQISKARGLKKKIVNPIDKEKKTILDFCFVSKGQGSISLKECNIDLNKCACTSVQHMKNCFYLFHADDSRYSGIMSENGHSLKPSSIEIDEDPILMFYCNIEGYSTYCKEYKEYFEWVKNRNPERFQNNLDHGQGYDSKNMMHCHRLLDVCIEVFEGKEMTLNRPNREYLLEIRAGKMKFDDILNEANEKIERLEVLYKSSTLPKSVDKKLCDQLLLKLRKKIYGLDC